MKPGGISTSLINMLHHLKGKNIQVDLFLFNDEISDETNIPDFVQIIRPKYLLRIYSKSVREVYNSKKIPQIIVASLLHFAGKFVGNKNLVNILIKFEKKRMNYDVAIAYSNDIFFKNKSLLERTFSGGSNELVIKSIGSKKKIGWIHSDPNALGFTYQYCKKIYQKYDSIITVSAASREKFVEIIPEYANKTKIINNLFQINKIKILSNDINPYETDEEFKFVTVCRINNEAKRIDRIINTCEILKQEGIKKFKWYIIGDGKDLDFLKNMARLKNVDDIIVFLGSKSNPYAYMKNSNCLVLSSEYEAQGLVLTEAHISGTPVIVTGYEEAFEFVNHGINGLICDNSTKGLYETIKKVLLDTEILENIKINIKNQEFSNSKGLKQLFEILDLKELKS